MDGIHQVLPSNQKSPDPNVAGVNCTARESHSVPTAGKNARVCSDQNTLDSHSVPGEEVVAPFVTPRCHTKNACARFATPRCHATFVATATDRKNRR